MRSRNTAAATDCFSELSSLDFLHFSDAGTDLLKYLEQTTERAEILGAEKKKKKFDMI